MKDQLYYVINGENMIKLDVIEHKIEKGSRAPISPGAVHKSRKNEHFND